MAFEIKQNLRTIQRLSLSTELKNSITILGLGRAELESFLALELEKNPCLVGLKNQTNFNLKKLTQNENLYTKDIPDTTQKTSLHNHILSQISMLRLSLYELECVNIILQYIDDSGYFTSSLELLSESHQLNRDDLSFALETVQRCEPIGIGARNLQECLLLQVKHSPPHLSYVELILREHWEDFEKQNISKIARALKIPLEDMKEVFRYVRDNLDPKPARQFGLEANQVVIPEVYVFKREDEWLCSLNLEGLPRIKLSKKYQSLLEELKKSTQQKDAVKYLNENLRSGKSLIRSLEERNKTILRVTETILKYQKDFFEHGTNHLVPLTLKDVSQELGLHESTISRSTLGKYLFSPRGIFELKYFFNSRMETNEGKEFANESIKQWVQEIIDNEDKTHPLSDQDITKKIAQEKSLKIARRTVTKYRESLGIMSSTKRSKKF